MENWYEALEQLARLRERGVLTDEEFAAEKARILSRREVPDRPAAHSDAAPSWWSANVKWLGGGIAAAVVLGSGLAYLATRDIGGSGSLSRAEAHRPAAKTAVAAMVPLKPDAAVDTAFTFASAAKCEPSGDLDKLVRAMQVLRPGEGDPAGIALESLGVTLMPQVRRVQPKADGPAAIVAEAQVDGRWQGLHLAAVRTTTWESAPLTVFQLRFREPVTQAETPLKRAGFATAHVGTLRLVGGGSAAGIETVSGGSALTCVHGYTAGAQDPEKASDAATDNSQPAGGPQGL
jgi:hypothetical protein